MEKSIIKKNVHLSEKEKQYVARLIQDGGTLEDISKWHKTRFGKPIARSKYYRLKSQVSSILADKLEKSKNKYTRKGEKDLQVFESHLKDEIAVRTANKDCQKWTFALLSELANQIRQKNEFAEMEILKSYNFSTNYWYRFMERQKLTFSKRKKLDQN